MNVKKILIEELEKFNIPVFQQGSMNDDEAYPSEFITFWLNSCEELEHYDDDVKSYEWDFQVIYYSNNSATIFDKAEAVRVALKKVGFIPQGRPNDIPSDEATHIGVALDYLYRETI